MRIKFPDNEPSHSRGRLWVFCLALSFVTLCVALFCIFRVERQKGNDITSFVEMGEMVRDYDGSMDDESLSAMEEFVSCNNQQYAPIGGRLLLREYLRRGELEKLHSLGESISSRVSSSYSFYHDYFLQSLLIEEGRYEEALKKARVLSMQISKNAECKLLYIINLLRVALLEERLNIRYSSVCGDLQAISYAEAKEVLGEEYILLKNFIDHLLKRHCDLRAHASPS